MTPHEAGLVAALSRIGRFSADADHWTVFQAGLDAYLSALHPTDAGVGEPVAWVSPEQFAGHTDPKEGGLGGNYLPVRRTRVGLFTMPLYASPEAGVAVGVKALNYVAFLNGMADDFERKAVEAKRAGLTQSSLISNAVQCRELSRLLAARPEAVE